MSNMVSRQYAKALFDLAMENGEVKEVYDNLLVLKKAFQDAKFKDVMESVNISKENKKEILKNILVSLPDSYFTFFHYVLVDNGRFDVYDQIVDAYKELLQEHLKIMDVDVYTKFNLTELEKQKLKKNLDNRFMKNVSICYHIDSKMIGGIKVITDGLVLDYSLDTQLEEMKKSIMKG